MPGASAKVMDCNDDGYSNVDGAAYHNGVADYTVASLTVAGTMTGTAEIIMMSKAISTELPLTTVPPFTMVAATKMAASVTSAL